MIASEVLVSNYIDSLRQRGIEVTRIGNQLQFTWDPSEPLTSADRQFICQHKTELLNLFNLEHQGWYCLAEIQKQVSTWPEPRQRQFDGLVQAYQNPDRGFGIKVRSRSREEAIRKGVQDLEPIVQHEMTDNQNGR